MLRLLRFDTSYEPARRVAESSHGHSDVCTPPSSYLSIGSCRARQQAFGCTALMISGKTCLKAFLSLQGLNNRPWRRCFHRWCPLDDLVVRSLVFRWKQDELKFLLETLTSVSQASAMFDLIYAQKQTKTLSVGSQTLTCLPAQFRFHELDLKKKKNLPKGK